MSALGLIEVYGYLGAIEAADSALKSANVNLIGCEKVKGGLVCVKFKGDVGAIKASIEAAENATKELGVFISKHVIARPDENVFKLANVSTKITQIKKVKEEKVNEEVIEEVKEVNEEVIEKTVEEKTYTKEELTLKTVEELRRMVRNIESDMTNKEIKYARKEQLISELSRYYKRGNK